MATKKDFEDCTKKVAEKFEEESRKAVDDYRFADWDEKMRELGRNGTDLEKNRNDPMGDGDQTPLKNRRKAQLHRDIWSVGGDTDQVFHTMPPFIVNCMIGPF